MSARGITFSKRMFVASRSRCDELPGLAGGEYGRDEDAGLVEPSSGVRRVTFPEIYGSRRALRQKKMPLPWSWHCQPWGIRRKPSRPAGVGNHLHPDGAEGQPGGGALMTRMLDSTVRSVGFTGGKLSRRARCGHMWIGPLQGHPRTEIGFSPLLGRVGPVEASDDPSREAKALRISRSLAARPSVGRFALCQGQSFSPCGAAPWKDHGGAPRGVRAVTWMVCPFVNSCAFHPLGT